MIRSNTHRARLVRDLCPLRRRLSDSVDAKVARVPRSPDGSHRGPTCLGASGFFPTDDGALIIGEPHVAATWFPVNDHPSDKASYTFKVTVGKGLEVVANGVLQRRQERARTTTWVWDAKAPMASYLATVNVGQFRLRSYRRDGIRYWDAIDPDLLVPVARPMSGARYALTRQGANAYKRLTRTVDVPAEGGELTFQVTRRIEPGFDFMMVEARPEGTDEWTTLPDQNGHTSWETGFACPDLVRMHPFLEHYLTRGGGGCSTHGSTGRWWAVTGESKGYERWVLDLSRYAGQTVHLSISYVTDSSVELQGLFVDDVDVPGQDGDTSFEDDSDPLDGWMVKGSPPGSPPNPNQWMLGTAKDAPPPNGVVAQRSFAKQDDIIRFLSRRFGQYPFRTAGGIVDDREIFFALENQTRPVYGPVFFFSQADGDLVVVHR